MRNEELDWVLNFDPLAYAERMTGEKAGDELGGPATMLGLAFMQDNNRQKERLLAQSDDTKFTNTVENYLRIAQDIGFGIELCESFTHPGYDHDDYLYVLWNPETSTVLWFDTYRTTHVNGAHWVCFWKPASADGAEHGVPFACSQVWDGDVGNLWGDGREALRYHMGLLAEAGKFVHEYPKRPIGFSLVHHGDMKVLKSVTRPHSAEWSKAYNEVHECRVRLLRPSVRDVICAWEGK